MVGQAKSNWHLQLFSTLWGYRTTVNTSTSFTPFQLVYELEYTLLIECKIPSLKLTVEIFPNTTVEEERFFYLNKIEETRCDVVLANKAHKQQMKSKYDRSFQPHSFNERDLILTYDQKHDKLGARKFESMWHKPYIISRVLEKGAYEQWNTMGYPWESPAMGSTLKYTIPKSSSIGYL